MTIRYQIEQKSIDDLLLDPESLRLPPRVNTEDEKEVIEYFITETPIKPLMQSIASNGFFPYEPILTVPAKNMPGKFHVIEGNCRLVAVKLLNDLNLSKHIGTSIKEIVTTANFTPNTLPVVTYQTRDEVLPYLGFRHISGVKEWEPLAKAKYIKQLFDCTSPKDGVTDRYSKVAQQIGTNEGYVKRMLNAFVAYEIIKEHNFYKIPWLNEESIKFTILSTAITDENIGKFLGFLVGEENKSTHPVLEPEVINQDRLKEIVHWFYCRTAKVRIPESRDVQELSCIVNDPKALKMLRDDNTLRSR